MIWYILVNKTRWKQLSCLTYVKLAIWGSTVWQVARAGPFFGVCHLPSAICTSMDEG